MEGEEKSRSSNQVLRCLDNSKDKSLGREGGSSNGNWEGTMRWEKNHESRVSQDSNKESLPYLVKSTSYINLKSVYLGLSQPILL